MKRKINNQRYRTKYKESMIDDFIELYLDKIITFLATTSDQKLINLVTKATLRNKAMTSKILDGIKEELT